MEPFKVICVTCQAKLSVRNEALIGQIVACPRCESMVEVARPASAARTGDAKAPPPIATPTAAEGASTGSTINITARQIDELSASATEATPDSEAHPTPVEHADATPPETIPAEAVEASAAVARYKLITWSIASFVVGAAIVGAVVYKSTRSNVAQPPTPSVTDLPSALDQSDQPITPYELAETTEEVATKPDDLPEPEPITNPAVEAMLPTQIAADNPAAIDTEPTPVDEPKPITPTPPPAAQTQTLTVEPAPRVARRFDPLEMDLESLSLETVQQPQTKAVEIPEADATTPAQIAPPVPEPISAPERTTQINQPESNEVASRDAAKQLALIIPTVEANEMRLVDALRLVSQLSGQPVSVAPEHLLMAGITAEKKVSLQVADMSMGDALQELLDPLRLEYYTDGPQIAVRRQEADKLRQIEYPIDDLLSKGQTETEIASWIEQLVAPDSWQSAGGDGALEIGAGSIKITQPQRVQYQVLIMLERLRLARNLPPKSRYPVKRLAGTPAAIVIAGELQRSTTFTFSQFTTLDEVFDYWQTKLELPLLIDWPALAAVDVWPSTTITAAVIDEPWHVALGRVLQPIGLDWRAATGGAVEITTAAKSESELQLELYPLQPTATVDLNQLRALADDGPGVVLHDTVGNVVLSLQPAATQRLILDALKTRQ